MIKKIIRDIQFFFRDITINKKNRNRLKNYDFSIISNDCLAGVISKDLRIQMKSPTRNFYFNAKDYVKFCKNLDYYLKLVPKEYTGDYTGYGSQFLMASLGDLTLFLVHYKSVEQARLEWERRRKRVNKNNLFFIMNDRNFCTEEDIKEFDQLPYENKICFTHIPYPQYNSTYYIRGSEKETCLKPLMDFTPNLGIKRYYDRFDFVAWFNHEL